MNDCLWIIFGLLSILVGGVACFGVGCCGYVIWFGFLLWSILLCYLMVVFDLPAFSCVDLLFGLVFAGSRVGLVLVCCEWCCSLS